MLLLVEYRRFQRFTEQKEYLSQQAAHATQMVLTETCLRSQGPGWHKAFVELKPEAQLMILPSVLGSTCKNTKQVIVSVYWYQQASGIEDISNVLLVKRFECSRRQLGQKARSSQIAFGTPQRLCTCMIIFKCHFHTGAHHLKVSEAKQISTDPSPPAAT